MRSATSRPMMAKAQSPHVLSVQKTLHVGCCTSRACSTRSPVSCLGGEPHTHLTFEVRAYEEGQSRCPNRRSPTQCRSRQRLPGSSPTHGRREPTLRSTV